MASKLNGSHKAQQSFGSLSIYMMGCSQSIVDLHIGLATWPTETARSARVGLNKSAIRLYFL